MTKWRRAALGFAGAIAAAVVAGALALHALSDPARIKMELREKARAAWSRDLDMGTVGFEIFPRPTLVANDVALANPPWAKERELLHADRVAARLALLPLLIGTVRVEQVSLEGARANLEVAPDGGKSWEMHPAVGGRSPVAPSAPGWMGIHALTISNGDVRYRPKTGRVEAWHVETASVEMRTGMRDVRFEAHVSRNGRALHAMARLSDLSRLGETGATCQGTVELDWGKTRVSVDGRIPLDRDPERATFNASLQSRSLEDMLAFFGVRERHTAPLQVRAEVTQSSGEIDLHALSITFGKHRMTGEVRLRPSRSPPSFTARLESDDLDWAQALVDAGYARPTLPPPGEMFPIRPLPWPLLVALQGTQGSADLKFGRLLLSDGIEVRHATGHMTFDGDRLDLKPFAAELLGGSATGAMRFEGRKKGVQVDIVATNVLLERWFHERHRPVPFTGGPMKVRAAISVSGASMKELAASMTGPVSILMGPGVYASKAAGDWEARMVRFSKKGSAEEIDFECAGAALPFVSGRATGTQFIGARSRESHLLVSGYVDLREETVDLRGPIRPKPDQGVGLSTIADDIVIEGRIRQMKVKLDPASTAKVIAKAGAAIATAGLSVVASAASNSSRSDPDPCEAVFTSKHPPRP